MTHTGPPSPAPAADLTRQRLIRAALELFTTRGYHDTTTAQIAKKAGVAEGTIYRHFPSKQQLLNELHRAALRWAAKLVQDAEAAGGGARARLALAAQQLVEGAARDPAVVKLGFLERLDVVLDDESRKTAREFRTAVERVIAQGKAEGVIRSGAADVWAAVWLAVISHALEKVVAKEWKPGDAAVALVIDGAWSAVGA
ncbi:MAG TPA: TetR/AcrR family transcriptional regulator [Gemmatimonadales bacterium]|nr:TetR/AcrR family transcriptional regulator [Gemmatimonadales bacterium]